jgi:predicted nucleic acid-binding protein
VSGPVLFDTDVLIDAGRGVDDAVRALHEAERRTRLALSAVTHMELIVGCRDKAELRALDRFLQRFAVLAVNEAISSQGVDLLRQYRLSHGLLIADALIAATALAEGAPLVSKNQRHYRFISDLNLLPYPNPFAML